MKTILKITVLFMLFALDVSSCVTQNIDSLLTYEFYKPLENDVFVGDFTDIEQLIEGDLEALNRCDNLYIVYKDSVCGYGVRFVLHTDQKLDESKMLEWNDDEADMFGVLLLSKGERTICKHYRFYLADEFLASLKLHEINTYIYNERKEDFSEKSLPHLGQFRNLPFFFFDIDIDGENELMINEGYLGQRQMHAYFPVKLKIADEAGYEELYNLIEDTEPECLYRIWDDMTHFDAETSTIIRYLSVGAMGNEWQYWQKTVDGFRLVREEMDYCNTLSEDR